MQCQQNGNAYRKFRMFGLVPEGTHPHKHTQASTGCRDTHKAGFGDPPEISFCLQLVRKHKKHACRID